MPTSPVPHDRAMSATTQGRIVTGNASNDARTGERVAEARLLVVDDEPNIHELLATSRRFAGCAPTSSCWT